MKQLIVDYWYARYTARPGVLTVKNWIWNVTVWSNYRHTRIDVKLFNIKIN